MINQWAIKWGIPAEAIADLQTMLGASGYHTATKGPSEASAQQKIVLETSKIGARMWRNNNGAAEDAKTGRSIRYGLANDSKQMNAKIKSSDLIGIRPLKITPAHVGDTIGVFTSIEVKKPGWKYKGTNRESAQFAWLLMVASFGGFAMFATGPEEVKNALS